MDNVIKPINTGEYEIIASGLFHALEDRDSVIQVNDLRVVINFRTQDPKDAQVEFEPSEKTINITFVNFHDSLGRGNTEPIRLADFDLGSVYLIYRVFSLSDKKIRTVEYSFLFKRNGQG